MTSGMCSGAASVTPHNYRVNLSAGGTNAATVTRVFARRRLRVRYTYRITGS
jgi:hypothetical protein